MMKIHKYAVINTRVLLYSVSLFIDMPWLYFVFEMTVLNIMLAYMIATHERFCAQFTKELESKS